MSDNVIDISESSVDSSDVTPNSRGSFNNEHTVESDPSTAEVEGACKQVRMLAFKNPGRFMGDFDPERSTREMKKVHRRLYVETVRRNQVYDETGRLLADSRDVCDCLVRACPGCHFACVRCSSHKCAGECRCNRRWVYVAVETEGTGRRVEFHSPPE